MFAYRNKIYLDRWEKLRHMERFLRGVEMTLGGGAALNVSQRIIQPSSWDSVHPVLYVSFGLVYLIVHFYRLKAAVRIERFKFEDEQLQRLQHYRSTTPKRTNPD